MNTITRTVPTLEAVKKALTADWLERDGGSFVYQKKTGRLDWEKSLPSGSAYSEELLSLEKHRDRLSEEELIRKAYGMAQTLLDTLDIEGRVRLRFNPSDDDSFTDGRTVTVSTLVLDDSSIDITHRLDILLGTAEHEGLHCEFTDFGVHSSDRIIQSLVNIVEDERIEHCAGEKYPGLANFLKEFKYYYHDLWRSRHRAELDSGSYPVRLLNAILALIRYPKALTDSEMEEFGEYLIRIREVLDSFPSSTAESMIVAQKIYDIIKEAVRTEPRESGSSGEGKKGEGKSDDGSGSGEGNAKGEGMNGEGSGSGKDDGEKAGSAGSGEDVDENGEEPDLNGEEDNDGNDGEGKSPKAYAGGMGCNGNDTPEMKTKDRETDESGTPSFGKEKEFAQLSDEDAGKALELIGRMLRSYEEDTDSSGQACGVVAGTPEIDRLCTGDAEHGSDLCTLFLKERDTDQSERQYLADRNAVQPYIPAMRNILVAQATRNTYALKGLKSGRLDGCKLPQAFIGSPNVYLQHREVKSSKIAVCVLVDESGSMYGNKILAARRTAVLLNEALGSLPNVDLFIYGHSADERLDSEDVIIRTYRDHTAHDRHAVGKIEARCDNADGYAILEVARRVRQQTAEKVLFFIISDGAPAARIYSSCSGVAHTREAVRKVTSQGFCPVQIAIDPYCDPSSMFDHHVSFTNLSDLPRDLSVMVKKAVLENTARR